MGANASSESGAASSNGAGWPLGSPEAEFEERKFTQLARKYDSNQDGVLDESEARDAAAVYGRGFTENRDLFDRDKDGNLDELELRMAERGETVISAWRLLGRLRGRMREWRNKKAAYSNLIFFLVFVAFYLALLFEQRKAFLAFSISDTLSAWFPDEEMYHSPDEILDWVQSGMVELWRDPVCGDGTCEPPFEFPAFGRVGCLADCEAQIEVTPLYFSLTAHYPTNTLTTLADQDSFLSRTTWNLCHLTLIYNKQQYCWWAEPQHFSAVEQVIEETLEVPDGEWELTVNAPVGGVRGKISRYDGATNSTILLHEWDFCSDPTELDSDDDTTRRRLLLETPGAAEVQHSSSYLRKASPLVGGESMEEFGQGTAAPKARPGSSSVPHLPQSNKIEKHKEEEEGGGSRRSLLTTSFDGEYMYPAIESVSSAMLPGAPACYPDFDYHAFGVAFFVLDDTMKQYIQFMMTDMESGDPVVYVDESSFRSASSSPSAGPDQQQSQQGQQGHSVFFFKSCLNISATYRADLVNLMGTTALTSVVLFDIKTGCSLAPDPDANAFDLGHWLDSTSSSSWTVSMPFAPQTYNCSVPWMLHQPSVQDYLANELNLDIFVDEEKSVKNVRRSGACHEGYTEYWFFAHFYDIFGVPRYPESVVLRRVQWADTDLRPVDIDFPRQGSFSYFCALNGTYRLEVSQELKGNAGIIASNGCSIAELEVFIAGAEPFPARSEDFELGSTQYECGDLAVVQTNVTYSDESCPVEHQVRAILQTGLAGHDLAWQVMEAGWDFASQSMQPRRPTPLAWFRGYRNMAVHEQIFCLREPGSYVISIYDQKDCNVDMDGVCERSSVTSNLGAYGRYTVVAGDGCHIHSVQLGQEDSERVLPLTQQDIYITVDGVSPARLSDSSNQSSQDCMVVPPVVLDENDHWVTDGWKSTNALFGDDFKGLPTCPNGTVPIMLRFQFDKIVAPNMFVLTRAPYDSWEGEITDVLSDQILPSPGSTTKWWCVDPGVYRLKTIRDSEIADNLNVYDPDEDYWDDEIVQSAEGIIQFIDVNGCALTTVSIVPGYTSNVTVLNFTTAVLDSIEAPSANTTGMCSDGSKPEIDFETIKVGWDGCPEAQRVRIMQQAGHHAVQVSWRLWLADSKYKPTMITPAGRSSFGEDNAKTSSEFCLEPGSYVMSLYDIDSCMNGDCADMYDYSSYLELRNPTSDGTDGATLTVMDGNDCVAGTLTITQDDSEGDLLSTATLEILIPDPAVASSQTVALNTLNGDTCTVKNVDDCFFTDIILYVCASHIIDDFDEYKQETCEAFCEMPSCVNRAFEIFGPSLGGRGCCEINTGPRVMPITIWEKGEEGRSLDHLIPKYDPSSSRKRYMGIQNRILGGLLIHQTRRKQETCPSKRFESLFTNCTSKERSTDPYGVDPAFLSTSELYRPELMDAMVGDQSTYTEDCMPPDCGSFYPANNHGFLNEQGVPYGFFSHSIANQPDGFPVFFDINLSEKAAYNLVQYLRDGFYMDELTDSVSMQMVLYNGKLRYFTNFLVSFGFTDGGKINMKSSVQTVSVEMYSFKADKIRFGFELIFALMVVIGAFSELSEIANTYAAHKSFAPYFVSGWNYIDLASIAMNLSCISTWIVFQVTKAIPFDMEPRYNVYARLDGEANVLQVGQGGDGMREMASRIATVQDMTNFQAAYMTINGVNVFFMMLRILKLCDFQPRMGIVTRTLILAASDISHFIVLLAIVLLGYSMMGHLVFGTTLRAFSTLWDSFLACFNMLAFGDNSVGEDLLALEGAELVPAVVFYFTFALLVVIVLLNFVLAIVVDAFAEVKQEAGNAASLPSEIGKVVAENVISAKHGFEDADDMLERLYRAQDAAVRLALGEEGYRKVALSAGVPVEEGEEDRGEEGRGGGDGGGGGDSMDDNSSSNNKNQNKLACRRMVHLGGGETASEEEMTSAIGRASRVTHSAVAGITTDSLFALRDVINLRFSEQEDAKPPTADELAAARHTQLLEAIQNLAVQTRSLDERLAVVEGKRKESRARQRNGHHYHHH